MLTNTQLYNNSVQNGNGGGIFVSEYSNVTLQDNTIVSGCHADINGGGIYASQKSYIVMRQSVSLRDNNANKNGGAFYLEYSSSSRLSNDIVFVRNKVQGSNSTAGI